VSSPLCAAILGASLRRAGWRHGIPHRSQSARPTYRNHERSPRACRSRITRACSRRGAVCWQRSACTSGVTPVADRSRQKFVSRGNRRAAALVARGGAATAEPRVIRAERPHEYTPYPRPAASISRPKPVVHRDPRRRFAHARSRDRFCLRFEGASAGDVREFVGQYARGAASERPAESQLCAAILGASLRRAGWRHGTHHRVQSAR
jgi:hypothetical protein